MHQPFSDRAPLPLPSPSLPHTPSSGCFSVSVRGHPEGCNVPRTPLLRSAFSVAKRKWGLFISSEVRRDCIRIHKGLSKPALVPGLWLSASFVRGSAVSTELSFYSQQLCRLVDLFESYIKGSDFKHHLARLFFFFNCILGEPKA